MTTDHREQAERLMQEALAQAPEGARGQFSADTPETLDKTFGSIRNAARRIGKSVEFFANASDPLTIQYSLRPIRRYTPRSAASSES